MEALVEGMPLIVNKRRKEADQNVKTAKSGGFFHPINGLVKMPRLSSNPSNEY
jgi:hypothetical protein